MVKFCYLTSGILPNQHPEWWLDTTCQACKAVAISCTNALQLGRVSVPKEVADLKVSHSTVSISADQQLLLHLAVSKHQKHISNMAMWMHW